MRLTEAQFGEILHDINTWRSQNGQVRQLTSERSMETFLNNLASGGFYSQVSQMRGVAESTFHLYTHDVVDYFMASTPNWNSFPRPKDFQEISMPFQDIYGHRNKVTLYIDGAIIGIQRPDHAFDCLFLWMPWKVMRFNHCQVYCGQKWLCSSCY